MCQCFCTITNSYTPIASRLRTVTHGNSTAFGCLRIITEGHGGTAISTCIGTEGLVIIKTYQVIAFIKTGTCIVSQRKSVRGLHACFVADSYAVVSNCARITTDSHRLCTLTDSACTNSNSIDILSCRIMTDGNTTALIRNARCRCRRVNGYFRTVTDGDTVLTFRFTRITNTDSCPCTHRHTVITASVCIITDSDTTVIFSLCTVTSCNRCPQDIRRHHNACQHNGNCCSTYHFRKYNRQRGTFRHVFCCFCHNDIAALCAIPNHFKYSIH